MRRFTYECSGCGSVYEQHVGGSGPPPGGVRCRCGQEAARQWVAPQVLVTDKEVDYRPKDFIPAASGGHDPYGRSARQIQVETDKLLRSKRRHAQRVKRDHALSRKRGVRHIGSIDAREMVAYNKRAGDKNAFLSDPVKALRRTGNHFGD